MARKAYRCKAALKSTFEFISEHSLLCEYQLGFRKGYSTHTAVIRLVDDFTVAIDKNLITLNADIDFTCAFDMVQISLFIHKLGALRFSDAACRWVKSYLSNRSQVVVFANRAFVPPREFEILTFTARHYFLANCLLAKILLSKTPAYLCTNFKFIVTDELGRSRCSPYDLDIGHFRTEYCRYEFYIGTAYL